MRKVSYAMSMSLDGFIEDVNGNLDWTAPDEELHKHFNDQEAKTDVSFYGRKLYELMSSYWPTAEENPEASEVEKEYARIWKRMKKIVFSKTLETVGWNSRLVRGNIAEEVNALKAQAGGNLTVGGAELATSFMQLGLIDEFWLYMRPVVLGGGKPMFGPLHDKINLTLVDTHRFGSGVMLLKYERAT